ncbi:tetratricopeptide repeat protein [Streptomyces sp. NPDC002328]|uniref:tetratricopeptide repeat protein n=1 Tax=Streptomyces sp. NPDC002328 TaxID=3364642 RepID=UPI0036A68423
MTNERSGIAAIAVALLESAQGGDPAAARRLSEVLPLLKEVAASGEVDAQNALGGILLEFEEDPSSAAPWFEKAAEQGSVEAKRSLGHLYANGLGVSEDIEQAERLFKEAAGQGDVYAQFNLAQLWWGKRDPEVVASLLRAAAEGGLHDAYVVLGDLLAAMDQDAQAFRCYLNAAESGHDGAMYVTACWYRDGTLGQPDKGEALVWFFRMLRAGNADGLHETIALARSMSDEEILHAGQRANASNEAKAMVGTVRKHR